MAEYSLRPDGRIEVVNSGFKATLEGKYSQVKAVAWRPDASRPGALKVRFFGLDDTDYSWAMVGNDTSSDSSSGIGTGLSSTSRREQTDRQGLCAQDAQG